MENVLETFFISNFFMPVFFFFPLPNFPPFCNKAYTKSRSDEKVITPCCNVKNMLIQLNMF